MPVSAAMSAPDNKLKLIYVTNQVTGAWAIKHRHRHFALIKATKFTNYDS